MSAFLGTSSRPIVYTAGAAAIAAGEWLPTLQPEEVDQDVDISIHTYTALSYAPLTAGTLVADDRGRVWEVAEAFRSESGHAETLYQVRLARVARNAKARGILVDAGRLLLESGECILLEDGRPICLESADDVGEGINVFGLFSAVPGTGASVSADPVDGDVDRTTEFVVQSLLASRSVGGRTAALLDV